MRKSSGTSYGVGPGEAVTATNSPPGAQTISRQSPVERKGTDSSIRWRFLVIPEVPSAISGALLIVEEEEPGGADRGA